MLFIRCYIAFDLSPPCLSLCGSATDLSFNSSLLHSLPQFLTCPMFIYFLSLPPPNFHLFCPSILISHLLTLLKCIFSFVSFCTLINPSDFIKHSLAILTSSSPFPVASLSLHQKMIICLSVYSSEHEIKNRVRPVLEGFQTL